MDYVFVDAPLFYLGKIRALEKVLLLSGKKCIPQSVYDEVVLKDGDFIEVDAEKGIVRKL